MRVVKNTSDYELHTSPHHERQVKAAKLRALAQLATNVDKLLLISDSLGRCGADGAGQAIHSIASRVAEAIDRMEIPYLGDI